MPEEDCNSIVITESFGKNYQPPKGLPFKSRGSYETDKGLYLRKRESLYRKNAVTWRRTTREILKASKAGTQADETEHKKVVEEHTTLTELDRFFDIREEC